MADDARTRVEIAFDGGQVLSVLVDAATADELEGALSGNRDDALALDAEDGRYTIPLRRVVYAKRFARESRVGFGAG